jgi:hypothetical protein
MVGDCKRHLIGEMTETQGLALQTCRQIHLVSRLRAITIRARLIDLRPPFASNDSGQAIESGIRF